MTFLLISISILFAFQGFPVTEEQLKEAAEESGVLNVPEDFLPPDVRAECERIMPDREDIKPEDCRDAYMYLKSNYPIPT